MENLNENRNSFVGEIVDFVKQATANEIKIALIVNTLLTIIIAFVADNFYELFKYTAIAWVSILVVCTALLKFTTRDVVKERHDKMYQWMTSVFEKYISNTSLLISSICSTAIIAFITLIFAKVTFFEVLVLIKVNTVIIIGTYLALKNSWVSKYIIPWIKKKFGK